MRQVDKAKPSEKSDKFLWLPGFKCKPLKSRYDPSSDSGELPREFKLSDLDREYSPSQWSHRMGPKEVIQAHVEVLTNESVKSRSSLEYETVSYGDSDAQKLHIFGGNTVAKDAPIVVYIHGGLWQMLSVELSSFAAIPLVNAGAVFVAVGSDLAPQIGMTEIVSQVKAAVGYLVHMAKRRQSRGVYLIGHSAGGHQAAMVLSVDWLQQSMINSSLIKGALLVSGIYDVRPYVKTYDNKTLQMTEEEAWNNSPEKHRDAIVAQSTGRQIIVAIAQHDPPRYRKDSIQFQQELLDAGLKSVKLIDVPNTDHFDVIESLRDPDFILAKELMNMVMSD